MKKVAIIGAGPAGLVTAKTLLDSGYDVKIFEQKDSVGGIWTQDRQHQRTFLSGLTPTNLSRFSVSFADLDWNAVNLTTGPTNATTTNTTVPLFPRASQVNRYLETYCSKFIPPNKLNLNREVTKASYRPGSQGSLMWDVTTKVDNGNQTESFDYLLIATGIFAGPRPLKFGIPSLQIPLEKGPIKIIHSSEYRSLNDLFPKSATRVPGNILIIGGANSGGEAAATIATHLSDSSWSPDRAREAEHKGRKIIHITSRPFYAMPPYLEYEAGSRSYMPLDLKFYDLSKKPAGPLVPSMGLLDRQKMDIVHGAIQAIVGGDQSELGAAALVSPDDGNRVAPYAALTEYYSEFVRSGAIDVIAGRVVSLDPQPDGTVSATVSHGESPTQIHNIGAIVYATGYTPTPALKIFDQEVKDRLNYDETNMRIPIILDQWQTTCPSIPEIGFVGFYEGPYWAVMEMQARLIAQRWQTDSRILQSDAETSQTMLDLRAHIQQRSPFVPQYWFADYPAQMECIASALSLTRNDSSWQEREGCPSPARYLSSANDAAAAKAVMADLTSLWQDCVSHGKFVARAVFRALCGTWEFHRTIKSSDPNFSGSCAGTASFHLRHPTPTPTSHQSSGSTTSSPTQPRDERNHTFDFEYLYIETSTFTSPNGTTVPATKRYIYRYSAADDKLSIWFVKPTDDRAVDYLFHELEFIPPHEAREGGACVARADHLCVADMYRTEYRLPMKAVVLPEFEVTHEVRGPKKDYVSTTRYSRPMAVRG